MGWIYGMTSGQNRLNAVELEFPVGLVRWGFGISPCKDYPDGISYSNCVPPPRRAGQPNSVITRIAVRVVVRFAVRFAVLISSAKRPDNPASLRSEYAEVCAYTR